MGHPLKNDKEWHKIGVKLTSMLGICPCQRKLKSIVDAFYSIYKKIEDYYENNVPLDFTGAEWVIIAQLDQNTECITHGTNCEYPILNKDHPFWVWILETHDNPYLEDN